MDKTAKQRLPQLYLPLWVIKLRNYIVDVYIAIKDRRRGELLQGMPIVPRVWPEMHGPSDFLLLREVEGLSRRFLRDKTPADLAALMDTYGPFRGLVLNQDDSLSGSFGLEFFFPCGTVIITFVGYEERARIRFVTTAGASITDVGTALTELRDVLETYCELQTGAPGYGTPTRDAVERECAPALASDIVPSRGRALGEHAAPDTSPAA